MKSFRLTALAVALLWLPAAAGPPVTLDTSIHHLEDRRLIVERTTPIVLPDPPEPVVREAAQPQSPEDLALAVEAWKSHRATHPWIHAGATVHRLPDGETLTHVSAWQVNNGDPISFWSSADFSLLAHPGSFRTSEGIHYSMLLFYSIYDIAKWQDLAHRRGIDYEAAEFPEFPEFPDGAATWIPTESTDKQNPLDAAAIAAAEAIHAHYRENLTELQADYAAREADQAARRAELEANPPQPRDIQLRVSRLTPEQAAAWHQHASARKGGRQ